MCAYRLMKWSITELDCHAFGVFAGQTLERAKVTAFVKSRHQRAHRRTAFGGMAAGTYRRAFLEKGLTAPNSRSMAARGVVGKRGEANWLLR
jgi:hypothetical protein